MKTFFNWSSGKDASMALYKLQQDKNYQVDRLLTSVNSHHDRVSMHGLRKGLLEKQIQHIGIPLQTIELPEQPTMEEYNAIMQQNVNQLKSEGFTHAAFGDIFLEDLRNYREKQLNQLDVQCLFPLWKRDTHELINEFIDQGFKAITVSVNGQLLDDSFVGRELDHSFINDLPSNVDPCGENGEFHTFCYDGPIFKQPVEFTIGEKIYREYDNPSSDETHDNQKKIGFWFCDLLE